jgi:hypothetical protein
MKTSLIDWTASPAPESLRQKLPKRLKSPMKLPALAAFVFSPLTIYP